MWHKMIPQQEELLADKDYPRQKILWKPQIERE